MLELLARALEAADAAAVAETIAGDVILHVAVHDEPFEGQPAATQILGAVLDALVAAHPGRADGLLVVRSGPDGRITDPTVFLRPLAARQALADQMEPRLSGPRPDGNA
jgi:hypothetical protein